MPWVAQRAPDGWKAAHNHGAAAENLGYEPLSGSDAEDNVDARKRAWAWIVISRLRSEIGLLLFAVVGDADEHHACVKIDPAVVFMMVRS